MSDFPAADEPMEPLPARMLNEFVYCPRLFYYEHVEGVFVHNADTRRGAALHKRVDAGKGALPAPSRAGEPASSDVERPAPIPDNSNLETISAEPDESPRVAETIQSGISALSGARLR
jgi:CRISP-associated protein Cas1